MSALATEVRKQGANIMYVEKKARKSIMFRDPEGSGHQEVGSNHNVRRSKGANIHYVLFFLSEKPILL